MKLALLFADFFFFRHLTNLPFYAFLKCEIKIISISWYVSAIFLLKKENLLGHQLSDDGLSCNSPSDFERFVLVQDFTVEMGLRCDAQHFE